MRSRPKCIQGLLLAGLFYCAGWVPHVSGADVADCRKLYLTGNYAETIRMAERAIADHEYEEEWRHLLVRALLDTGQYAKAQETVVNAISRFPSSIQLRVIGHQTFRSNGNTERADQLLREINALASSRTWAYTDPPNLVALGRAAVLMGAEPKLVLENFYERARQRSPELREAPLAIAEMAIAKGDFELAAKTADQALKTIKEDAGLFHVLARAWAPSDRRRMGTALDEALRINTNHVPSLLLVADHLIDAEDYPQASQMLERALRVNPWHPDAWAYRAVMAHLKNDASGEKAARASALKFWTNNPAPLHLIGRKLSAKYRFAEGAAYQRQALGYDTNYIPAKLQLAQDLLRIGEEAEGWRLVEEVHETDGYDVLAYNLTTLKENWSKFQTITNEHFVIRMSRHEAQVYGWHVLDLLNRARAVLVGKYGATLKDPTYVEIFPEQSDFAMRTFGELGGIGYLGVCFGRLVTANSPASTAHGNVNWESVLWHEFCHVVTLQMTRNKMPRWLSEGISVHEELQANPAWGQTMTPRYREMILGDDLTPVSELSAAFLTAKSGEHLQFAYYESALVVEFITQRFGTDALKNILVDLGNGMAINDALAKNTVAIDKLDADFAAFAKGKAEKLAPGLDFERINPREVQVDGLELLKLHPKNFWVQIQQARRAMAAKDWTTAQGIAEKLLKDFPSYTGKDNAYAMLAEIHRERGETEREREVLEQLAARSSDATDAYLRLMELHERTTNWHAVSTNASRYLAVNPLRPQPYRFMARAGESLGHSDDAVAAYRTMLLLDPPDPAGAHFSLARLLLPKDREEARDHVLRALEDAPRFREAHRLLLDINREKKPDTEKPPVP